MKRLDNRQLLSTPDGTHQLLSTPTRSKEFKIGFCDAIIVHMYIYARLWVLPFPISNELLAGIADRRRVYLVKHFFKLLRGDVDCPEVLTKLGFWIL
jgi:hypothetical protein